MAMSGFQVSRNVLAARRNLRNMQGINGSWRWTMGARILAAARQEASNWCKTLPAIAIPAPGAASSRLAVTIGPFVVLWLLTWLGLYFGYWISLLLVDSGGRLPRPPVHDPARLRPRLVLPQQGAQRLDRPRDRRAHLHAVRFLAPHPRGASRLVRQSDAPRHGRHRHADGAANISRCSRLGPAALSRSTAIRW